MSQANLKKIRANINRRKIINSIFAIAGIIVIMVAITILLGLVIQMAIEGSERITPEFFTSFPSYETRSCSSFSFTVTVGLLSPF